MWNYSSADDNWIKKVEKLDKRIFNYLRQEIESVRFYSKCLDGTSYVSSQDLDDIYGVLKHKENTTYKIDNTYSSSFSGTYSSNGIPVKSGDLSDTGVFYRYNKEYGFTLKNLFTPTRLINDSTNYLNVDVATTESLNFNNIDANTSLILDGITLKESHRVLIKDNVTVVTLDSSVDPDTYFSSNYYFIEEQGSTKDYYYYNNTNGIYKYTSGILVKESDLDDYSTNIRYSVSTKLGDINISKQFHLSRLSSGIYPLTSNSEPIEFTEKENFIIRNSLEYRNTLDNQFYSGLVQQPTTLNINSVLYQIPFRFMTVGDFGFIVNYQDNYPNILKNKYKEDLRDITELDDKYLSVGKNGTLLSQDKVTLIPTLVELDTFQNLNSIDFIDSDKGVIVGEDGTIILTRNQYDWKFIESDIKNDLKKSTFINLSTAVIVGNNGVVERLTLKSNNKNELTSENLVIKSDLYDVKSVVKDLEDVDYLETKIERFKFTGNDWVDILKNIGNSDFSIDFRFKPTELNGDSTILSFLTSKFPTTSGPTTDKGIKVIIEEGSGNYRIKMYVNKDSDLLEFIVIDGDINVLEDVWYHVFISRDKGEYKLFVNQKFINSTDEGFKGSFDNFNNRVRLGSELSYNDNGTASNTYSSTSFNHFIGSIDQVRLFDKKLDDTEVEVFSNNYQDDLSGLSSWYKFNAYKPENTKTIRTKDIITGTDIIHSTNLLTYNSNGNLSYIDTEEFTGIIISGEDLISIVLDVPENYSNQSLTNQLFIKTDTKNIKSISYNSDDKYLYGVSDSVFRIDIEKFEFDLFNEINVLSNITEEILLNEKYNNLSIDRVGQKVYLIGGINNQTETLDIPTICNMTENDPLENCGVYITVSTIINTNGYTIENDYRNDITDNINISSVEYIKTLGYPGSTQSVLKIPVGLSGSQLNPYEELYVSLTVDELTNGYFEISFDGNNFQQLDHNGDYLIPMSVGSDSSITLRAILSDDPNGNKIKGIIKDLLIYEASCVQIETSIYDGGTNTKKLYFSQFDTQTQLNKLGTASDSALYSYIDIKSLEIDSIEQILSVTYSNTLPKYLYRSDFTSNALVNCDSGNLCDYNGSLTNDTIDRVQFGLGIQVDVSGSDYEYIGDSYGLLESFTINSNQIFGLDEADISNGTSNVSDPYHLGIDFTKSLRFEVDSMIIDSDDLLDSDITNGATTSQYVILDATTVSYGTLSGTYFNQISFTASSGLTHSIITDETLNENQLYYLEFQLDGDVTIDFGSQSFSYSATGSIINVSIRMDGDYTTFEITNDTTQSDIVNLVLTDRIPTKSIIEWNPDTCNLSYRLNGVEQEDLGFLQSDGGGEYTPSCSIINSCDNDTLSIIDEDYWDKFKSKLLFLDYDIASKLYFFDTNTDNYQLPNTVNISDISVLSLNSINGQKSWIDYSKDSTKEFQYMSIKNDSNVVSYSSTFTNVDSSTYSIILNGNSTNDILDINGATQGLLPNFDSGTVSVGTPPLSSDFYFYGKYLVIKQPLNFSADLGDVINLTNSLVSSNMMVIYKLIDGADTYLYLVSNFNKSMTNRLTNWIKSTIITNINQFESQSDLIDNVNNHPIGVGYNLTDNDDGTLSIDTQYNPKTAYYNLQCTVVTNSILDTNSQDMEYINKVLSFGYSATYNILDYLSKNSNFNSDYIIGSLPQYTFDNSNTGVIYTISSGQISFNSSMKSEWESIPNYTFVDMTFGSDVIESILIIGKSYDESSDRYIIQTYNYYGHIYDQTDVNDSPWTLRVRNKLGEISSDLQKFNNIQRTSSNGYDITDLSNNQFTTFTNLKSELNFKPNTDSYAKALLSQSEIKEYLSGLLYTDFKNELAINIVNLSEEKNLTITSINKFNIECNDCTYESYTGFENTSNNIIFNQVSLLDSNTYYTNRVPLSSYGFNNQILLLSASGSVTTDFPIIFSTSSGTKTLEFTVEELVNATVEVIKDSVSIAIIGSQPNDTTKVQFADNGVNDLLIRVNYIDGSNTVKINDIRVGEELCIDNCYLTELKVNNHGLNVGDGLIVDITDDIFNLDNQYISTFDIMTISGWEQDISGVTGSIGLTAGVMEINISSTMSIYLPDSFIVTKGDMYRLSFDYELTFISGTPSISPSFGTSSNLENGLGEFSINGQMQHVEVNFIPTDSNIFIGFNLVDDAELTLNNISFDKLTNVGQYYDGYQIVTEVIDGDTFVIDSPFNGKIEELSATFSFINDCGQTKIGTTIITNLGQITQFLFDPYLNYAPIDLFELGNDDKLKQSIEIKPNNWVENNDETISLVNIDMTNYRFRLIDGLSLSSLNDDYPWILESEIRNALIGKDENGLVWYSGIWDCGRWFNGTWYSGTWRDGEWYNGIWNNSVVEDLKIKANVTILDSSVIQSTWYNGNFRNGTWNNGEWRNGNHYNGIWNNGIWNCGTWHLGTWNNGSFRRGVWIDGTWEQGTFSCGLGISSWLNGTWNGGNFNCGHWYNGRFDSKTSLSTFGKESTPSRPSVWENGNFINGEFNSGDNTDHENSIWKLGYWNGGTWNGGTAHQINWNNGTWNNGVVKDIKVVAFFGNSDGLYFFTLEGDWQFKIGDTMWIINNGEYSDIYGSDVTPGKYKVDQDFITVNDGEYTKVVVSKVPVSLSSVIGSTKHVDGYLDNNNPSDNTIDPTQITSIVSYISKVDWYNGQLQNGIFDGNFFRDGIWEKGSFKSGDFGY